ncbi:hypothetical protein HanRHA438_Chr15g0716141 [Helianthus annuus]|nr:hypothetical protein HanRHA438_Chr15g0716141 [Helianthus annuus]
MSVSLEIAGMLPMVCQGTIYPSNKMTNHKEHTRYFQKVGTKRETTGTIQTITHYSINGTF